MTSLLRVKCVSRHLGHSRVIEALQRVARTVSSLHPQQVEILSFIFGAGHWFCAARIPRYVCTLLGPSTSVPSIIAFLRERKTLTPISTALLSFK